jgi:hypothetical protein
MNKEHLTDRQIFDSIIDGDNGDSGCSCAQCSERKNKAMKVSRGFRDRAFDEFPLTEFQPIPEETAMEKKKSTVLFLSIGAGIAACIVVAVMLGFNREKVTPVIPEDLSGLVVFASGEAFINDIPAKNGAKAQKGDTLSTKSKSALTVQFKDSALVTMGENALLSVESLANGSNGKLLVSLVQQKGNTYNKIKKGEADYSVRSKTTVAAVRGTSFTVSSTGSGMEVKLLNGAVHMTDTIHAENIVELVPGKAVSTNDQGFAPVRALSTDEVKGLEKLDAIALENIPSDSSLPAITVPADALDILKSAELEKKMTLAEIKEKMGPLSSIKTYSGKVYIGAFVQTGRTMEITTSDGVFKIPSNQIENVTPYKIQQ